MKSFFDAFRPLQAFEAWAYFGDWIQTYQAKFGPGVRERFAAAAEVLPTQAEAARKACAKLRSQVRAVVGSDTVLCLPTTPAAAPAIDATEEEVEAIRFRMLCMTAIAGVSGLPQVSLPLLRTSAGNPVGLSFIGPPNSDRELLALAEQIAAIAANQEAL
ncbi:amidase family protein [Alkalilimnicola ehrlichii]|uniref:amidase family protein n=1 Tax=Alkalilimnicola ehrlichii TaxID=351052 RepID=UPI0015F29767|nr:amidase family protein [Alkalilimnicola ehrlichii]